MKIYPKGNKYNFFFADLDMDFIKKSLYKKNVYFSIEIRAGNGSDYKGNPLCNWINFKNAQNSFSLAECISHSRWISDRLSTQISYVAYYI